MKILWWRRPDLILHPAGFETWELRATSPRGTDWLHVELNDGGIVVLHHDAALEIVFRAIRAGLVVCSDPYKEPKT